MSEQALDLRRSVRVVRRHRLLVGITAVLGLLAGVALALLSRPVFTSTALIVLPGAPQSAQATAGPGTGTFMETQAVIAGSDPVLSGALPHITPPVSLQKLRGEVQASSQTSNILSISARARTAAQAVDTTNAVARSYVSYITSPRSLVGQVSANMLQPALNATGTSRVKRLAVYGAIGAVAGVLIGVILALRLGRGDRRLRERDDIANCIGVPVLASFPVAHPTDPAGWTELLEGYEPAAVHALHLRQALQQLGILDATFDDGIGHGISSLAVLSLSSDPRAVAIGPQVAVFAASLGIPTTLVIGPQQDAAVAATLQVACSAPLPASSKRPPHLRVAVADHLEPDRRSATALTVVVAVVDVRSPQVADAMSATSTVLGVSAGAATADQLARAAASAAAVGREIVGIFVADPEPTDRTSGRIPQLKRPVQRSLSTRLRGITTELKR